MKKFYSLLFILSTLFLSPSISFAEVSQIVFTTPEQSIKPNTLSEPVTIQAQDSSGSVFQTPETIDLEFFSTSGTGEFLGSTGNAATKYMSTNTANRTFYYKDSTSGTFTITVNALGRTSGKTWTQSQKIDISSSANAPTSLSGAQSSSLGVSQSFTSTQSSVSSGSAALDVVISGGDRLTTLGSPVLFQALIKKNTINDKLNLYWSFGDGEVGSGEITSHSYKYAGEYVVVLNAKASNTFSVSRVKVKVVEPDLEVKKDNDYIEIVNNSNNEINLFNWKLLSEGKGFIFQPDTIVLPKSKIKIDNSLLTMRDKRIQNTVLKNVLNEDVVNIDTDSSQDFDVSKISLEIESINQKALALLDQVNILGEVAGAHTVRQDEEIEETSDKKETVAIKEDKKEIIEKVEPIIEATDQTNIIYESPKKESIVSKLTNFIKRVVFE